MATDAPPRSTFDDVDLDGIDVDADLLQPCDGGTDLGAAAVDFEAHNAHLVIHAGLANVGDDVELLAKLPDDGAFDFLRRIGGPDARPVLAVGRIEVPAGT